MWSCGAFHSVLSILQYMYTDITSHVLLMTCDIYWLELSYDIFPKWTQVRMLGFILDQPVKQFLQSFHLGAIVFKTTPCIRLKSADSVWLLWTRFFKNSSPAGSRMPLASRVGSDYGRDHRRESTFSWLIFVVNRTLLPPNLAFNSSVSQMS